MRIKSVLLFLVISIFSISSYAQFGKCDVKLRTVVLASTKHSVVIDNETDIKILDVLAWTVHLDSIDMNDSKTWLLFPVFDVSLTISNLPAGYTLAAGVESVEVDLISSFYNLGALSVDVLLDNPLNPLKRKKINIIPKGMDHLFGLKTDSSIYILKKIFQLELVLRKIRKKLKQKKILQTLWEESLTVNNILRSMADFEYLTSFTEEGKYLLRNLKSSEELDKLYLKVKALALKQPSELNRSKVFSKRRIKKSERTTVLITDLKTIKPEHWDATLEYLDSIATDGDIKLSISPNSKGVLADISDPAARKFYKELVQSKILSDKLTSQLEHFDLVRDDYSSIINEISEIGDFESILFISESIHYIPNSKVNELMEYTLSGLSPKAKEILNSIVIFTNAAELHSGHLYKELQTFAHLIYNESDLSKLHLDSRYLSLSLDARNLLKEVIDFHAKEHRKIETDSLSEAASTAMDFFSRFSSRSITLSFDSMFYKVYEMMMFAKVYSYHLLQIGDSYPGFISGLSNRFRFNREIIQASYRNPSIKNGNKLSREQEILFQNLDELAIENLFDILTISLKGRERNDRQLVADLENVYQNIGDLDEVGWKRGQIGEYGIIFRFKKKKIVVEDLDVSDKGNIVLNSENERAQSIITMINAASFSNLARSKFAKMIKLCHEHANSIISEKNYNIAKAYTKFLFLQRSRNTIKILPQALNVEINPYLLSSKGITIKKLLHSRWNRSYKGESQIGKEAELILNHLSTEAKKILKDELTRLSHKSMYFRKTASPKE